jgi:hypothetical protein
VRVANITEPFGCEPKGRAFPHTFSQKTLVFCAVRVGSLVENSGARTTFLLRYRKSQNEPSLTRLIERDLAPRARFELATLRLTATGVTC